MLLSHGGLSHAHRFSGRGEEPVRPTAITWIRRESSMRIPAMECWRSHMIHPGARRKVARWVRWRRDRQVGKMAPDELGGVPHTLRGPPDGAGNTGG